MEQHYTRLRAFDPVLLYTVVATPVLILLCVLIAPFGSPDEYKHFERVVAIADGYVTPAVSVDLHAHRRDTRVAGAPLDAQVEAVADEVDFGRSSVNPAFKITLAKLAVAARRYPNGNMVFVEHSNTALYPPALYIPAIVGIAIGKLAGLPILLWMYCGRLANALAMVAAVVYAARRNRPAAFAITVAATLPTLIFQGATLSADAMVFALFLLFASLLGVIMRAEPLSPMDKAVMACSTVALAVGKVAYLPLAILPVGALLLKPRRDTKDLAFFSLTAVVSVLLWLAWSWLVHDKVFSMRPDVVVNPLAQALGIVSDPMRFVRLLTLSISSDLPHLLADAVGHKLAYETITLNKIVCAGLLLLLAIVGITKDRSPVQPGEWRCFLLVCSVSITCVIITYGLLYLQYNAVGRSQIEGAQGRYLAPLIVLMIVTCPFTVRLHRCRVLASGLASVAILAIPVMTLGSVVNRYWL